MTAPPNMYKVISDSGLFKPINMCLFCYIYTLPFFRHEIHLGFSCTLKPCYGTKRGSVTTLWPVMEFTVRCWKPCWLMRETSLVWIPPKTTVGKWKLEPGVKPYNGKQARFQCKVIFGLDHSNALQISGPCKCICNYMGMLLSYHSFPIDKNCTKGRCVITESLQNGAAMNKWEMVTHQVASWNFSL